MGMGASSSLSFYSSSLLPWIMVKMLTRVRSITIMSYRLITYFNIKKANMKTKIGAMFITIEMMVSGIYFTTEY